ncbi:hypothetical protein OHR86_00535 [Streptomyces sp. NBC_00441]|uniref:hypothetical protein n=1 Tax=Streptomyces sp. NBC_00441 TaxID=2975742 RepID=UPI002E2E8787|nr:hypothetical protein [Streptomyces sp. NBC_00441]
MATSPITGNAGRTGPLTGDRPGAQDTLEAAAVAAAVSAVRAAVPGVPVGVAEVDAAWPVLRIAAARRLDAG